MILHKVVLHDALVVFIRTERLCNSRERVVNDEYVAPDWPRLSRCFARGRTPHATGKVEGRQY